MKRKKTAIQIESKEILVRERILGGNLIVLLVRLLRVYLRQTWEWGCNGPSCRRGTRPFSRRPPPRFRRIAPAKRNDVPVVADVFRRSRRPPLLSHLQTKNGQREINKMTRASLTHLYIRNEPSVSTLRTKRLIMSCCCFFVCWQ